MKKEAVFYVLLQALLIAAVFVAIVTLAGCKPLESTSSSNTNQSLITERFDSAFDIAGDNAMAKLLIRCDSLGNAHLESFMTEQGKRIRLELQLRGAMNQIDSLQKANSGTNAPYVAPRNTPLLIDLDCKEDSFQQIIRCQRERIAYFEEREKETKEPVKYIPDFYKNCTIGFWLFVLLFVIKIAAWVMEKFPATAPYILIARKFIPFL